MLDSLISKFRDALESIAPSPETIARRDALALQTAWCSLLAEVARIDPEKVAEKRKAAALAMCDQFALREDEPAAMIENAEKRENRLTSYYSPVALINRRCSPGEKVALVEQLWRVAAADGRIDPYEDDLVRRLSDLLYVEHADFILAKHRVLNGKGA
jgi:uncharacterized tellurite resistance protein B-like protein